MKIKMNKTMPGSPNGLTVNLYKKDEIYDMPESLSKVFVDDLGIAESTFKKVTIETAPITEKDMKKIKAKSAAPVNKAAGENGNKNFIADNA